MILFFMQAPEMDFHYIGMQSNGICSTRGQQGTIRFLNKRLLELSKLFHLNLCTVFM